MKILFETTSHEATPWYQQGQWPLVGAILVLCITNGIAVWLAYYNARKGLNKELILKKIGRCETQLSDCYNLILSLLQVNNSVFKRYGPKSFPTEEDKRQVAHAIWISMRDAVILVNNEHILQVLKEKSHLLISDDDISNYTDLITHICLYREFVKQPTQIQNRFPESIQEHVKKQVNTITAELIRLQKVI